MGMTPRQLDQMQLTYLKQQLDKWKHAEELMSGSITAFNILGHIVTLDVKYIDFGTIKRSSMGNLELMIEKLEHKLNLKQV